MFGVDEPQGRLRHVYWIGGPPDSGKTTVANAIAERYGWQLYHFDRHEPAHFARADPERHPALYAAHPDRMTTEERWLGSPPDEMARVTIASWSERREMMIEDLMSLPGAVPIVAEGPGLFPQVVAPLIASPRHAVFLIPDDDFKRDMSLRRGKPGNRHQTSDPERATEQLIARDLLMGAAIRQQARAAGLRVINVGHTTPLESVLEQVLAWFALDAPDRS